MMSEKMRVYCLYRVSTDKQVDYGDNHAADIPVQRKACHRFAAEKGWEIIHEEQEEGVSGHEVRAEHRDKLQIIKEHALQGKFDILLVFMFDRIGRIADETPFVVEWFVRNGIQVWSTQEGEQRFDNHTDKLLNYIRFWQADGESEKTSIRTKTSLHQSVEAGGFKGGVAPYGFDLVKSGRVNKRKHEVSMLKVNETEAAVVKIIFDKYVKEGFGPQRTATFLNNNGYRARTGKMWHPASIRGILGNLTYTGVLRCGDARSEQIPELKIISTEQFEAAQHIREARSNENRKTPIVPLNTKGESLLAGNVYCGHCGARLTLTTNGRYRKLSCGLVDTTQRVRYVCYGKTRKQTQCDGPTGYTMHLLDEQVEQVIRNVVARMKGVSKSELVAKRYEEEISQRKAHYAAVNAAYTKAAGELADLKAEIIRSIRGESAFPKDVLAELIRENETKCLQLEAASEQAKTAMVETEAIAKELQRQHDDILSFADLYDSAGIAAKKMVVSAMIRRVEVSRDYKLTIYFNFNLDQFLHGLDCGGTIQAGGV